ncbi:hypothetical protein [Halobacillus litoralis]|nr:hypothetical protein [Halobacillus litoralis]
MKKLMIQLGMEEFRYLIISGESLNDEKEIGDALLFIQEVGG